MTQNPFFKTIVWMCVCLLVIGCQIKSGDPNIGENLFLARDKGHCLLCHQLRSLDAPSQGNLGPDLTGVGNRLSLDELINRIKDSRSFNPQTIMPAYHSSKGLHQVAPQYRGQPVLTYDEVLHVATYLSQQKSTP